MPTRQIGFYSDAMASGRYGLARYAQHLLSHLQRESGLSIQPLSAHCRRTGEDLARFQTETGYRRLPWPRKVIAPLWSLLGWPALERWAPALDLVHALEPDYRVATRLPLVVTVHDIGPVTNPEWFANNHPWMLRRSLEHLARHAAAVVCVSQATATELERFLGRRIGDRLHVIAEGVDHEVFSRPTPLPPGLAAILEDGRVPFFLWAGSVSPRKNLARLVEAFEQVADRTEAHLVLVGEIGWTAEETLRRIQASPLARRIHLAGRVDDPTLVALFQRALAFLYPSLMEGFGLPILEAMAAGCPVITSNLSSMPEVAGSAALLVDPKDAGSMGEAMLAVARDDSLRQRLMADGRKRAAGFRWDECAHAYVALYRRLIT